MIDVNDPINNKQRKFGSANEYLLAYVLGTDNVVRPALLTPKEVSNAVERAAKNAEDLPSYGEKELVSDQVPGVVDVPFAASGPPQGFWSRLLYYITGR